MATLAARIAHCDEMLVFLAAHDEDRKLRSLAADIEELRAKLRAELVEFGEASSGSPDEAAS
jgi:hypothetical protein